MNGIFFNKVVLVIVFLVGFISIGYSQGGWDLGYTPIDSVENSLIGKEIRLDFKSSYNDIINGNVSGFEIRRLLTKKDTIKLKIDGKEKEYIEDWKFYVDHGILSDQSLKEIDGEFLINETLLQSINDSTITVKMNFYKPKKCKSENKVLSGSKIVTIDRAIIKGVLFRRNGE